MMSTLLSRLRNSGRFNQFQFCQLQGVIDQNRSFGSKRAKKSKQKGGSDTVGKRLSDDNDIINMVVACLDSKPSGEPVDRRTPDEMERRAEIGRAYTVGMFERHNDENHDFSCKIKMKKFAIDAIPVGFLKEEALNISKDEDSIPPLWRPFAYDTPPIDGFNPRDWIKNDNDDGNGK